MTYYFEAKEVFSYKSFKFGKGYYKTEDVEFVKKYQSIIDILEFNKSIQYLDFDVMKQVSITYKKDGDKVNIEVKETGIDVVIEEDVKISIEDVINEIDENLSEVSETKLQDSMPEN